MSQAVFSSINPSSTSGNQLATILNDFKNAMMSGLKGPSRPSQTTAGGGWIDDSAEGSTPSLWTYKIYTGSTDISVFRINLSTSTASLLGADDFFTVTKISADAVGALATLAKKRIANNGQVLADDVIGEFRFVGQGSDNSSPVVARMKAVATQNSTGSANGTYVAIEGTVNAAGAVSEFARFYNGFLGVGITDPSFTIHARGNSGIKTERLTDDDVGTRIVTRKARLAGTGAGQSADVLATMEFNSQDSESDEFTAVKITVSATEAHTDTARGSKMVLAATKIGEAAPTNHMEIGEQVEVLTTIGIEGYVLNAQSVATTATIAALSADKAIVNFTGSTATTVQGISATNKTKAILIHNGSSAKITLEHNNGTASANDRLKLPKSRNIIIDTDSSVELFYSTVDSRWKLKSGSGGGGGEMVLATSQAITGGGAITISTDSRQLLPLSTAGGNVNAATLAFGNTLTPDAPMEFTLIAANDDDTVTLTASDVDYGLIIVGGGDTIDIAKTRPVRVVYNQTLKRFYVTRGV